MSLLAQLLVGIIQVLLIAIFARAIISWLVVAGIRNDFIFRLDYALSIFTEPIIRPLRRVIPPLGMIDLTPLVAIIILIVIQRVIVQVL